MRMHDVVQKGNALVLVCISRGKVNVAINRKEYQEFSQQNWDGPKRISLHSLGFNAVEQPLPKFQEFLEKNPEGRVRSYGWGWTIAPRGTTAAASAPDEDTRDPVTGDDHIATVKEFVRKHPALGITSANPTANTIDDAVAAAGKLLRIELLDGAGNPA